MKVILRIFIIFQVSNFFTTIPIKKRHIKIFAINLPIFFYEYFSIKVIPIKNDHITYMHKHEKTTFTDMHVGWQNNSMRVPNFYD